LFNQLNLKGIGENRATAAERDEVPDSIREMRRRRPGGRDTTGQELRRSERRQGNRGGGGGGGRFGGGRPGRSRAADRVWVLDSDGTLRQVPVRTGLTDQRYVEVLRGGLEDGDMIVVGAMEVSGSQSGQGSRNPFSPQRSSRDARRAR